MIDKYLYSRKFIEDLLSKIKTGQLSDKENQVIGEMFFKLSFLNSDNKCVENEDIEKYLFAGYYLYNNLKNA
jgi:hypothetical protein